MNNTDKMEYLLTMWGFSNFYQVFLEYGLDDTTFIYLNNSQMEKILGSKNFGQIIKFKKLAKKYRKDNVSFLA